MNVFVYDSYDCGKQPIEKYVAQISSEKELCNYIIKNFKNENYKYKIMVNPDDIRRVDVYMLIKGTPIGRDNGVSSENFDSWDWIECHYAGSFNPNSLCQQGDCSNIKSIDCRCKKRLCSSCISDHMFWHKMMCPINNVQRLAPRIRPS